MPPAGQPASALREVRDDERRPNKWPAVRDQASPQSLPQEAKDDPPDGESAEGESALRKKVRERHWLQPLRFSGQGSGGKPVQQGRTYPDHWLLRLKPNWAAGPCESLRAPSGRNAWLRGSGGTSLPNLLSGSRPRHPSR